MQRNIVVYEVPITETRVELCERKGLGHPDTLIDGIMEEVSIRLSHTYMQEYGAIQHHNVDKGLIIGGETQPTWGGGKFIKPIEVILAGRATTTQRASREEIAVSAAKEFLRTHVRHLDVDDPNQIRFTTRFNRGSADLCDVFNRAAQGEIPSANDTSFGIGYAPLTPLEKNVLSIEQYLNSADMKKRYPAIGEDIKVMGMREDDRIRVTVALAMVSRYLSCIEEYRETKEKIREEVEKRFSGVEVAINTADNYKTGSVYLTLTGLSMEMGDDGSVGRGNRANGLITPGRPMTLEATSGKNPVNHVGKIYTVAAFELANQIAALGDIHNVNVYLLSQIGKPIDHPKSAGIEISFLRGVSAATKTRVRREAAHIADAYLASITTIREKILSRKLRVFY